MNELPILLCSQQLYSLLQSQKIKTLQQASKHNSCDSQKQQKITQTLKCYANILQEVNNGWNAGLILNRASHLSPLQYYLHTPSIIQIVGSKGVGKTGYALYLCRQFDEVTILNCGGGITPMRLHSLNACPTIDVTCKDIFTLQQLLTECMREKKTLTVRRRVVLIDSMTNLLMPCERIRMTVARIFDEIAYIKHWVIFTNYVQNKIYSAEQCCYGGIEYYSAYVSEMVHCKINVQNKNNQIEAVVVKSMHNLEAKEVKKFDCFGVVV